MGPNVCPFVIIGMTRMAVLVFIEVTVPSAVQPLNVFKFQRKDNDRVRLSIMVRIRVQATPIKLQSHVTQPRKMLGPSILHLFTIILYLEGSAEREECFQVVLEPSRDWPTLKGPRLAVQPLTFVSNAGQLFNTSRICHLTALINPPVIPTSKYLARNSQLFIEIPLTVTSRSINLQLP
jgi:hypothetical protein